MAEGIWNKIILWSILLLFVFIFLFALYSKDNGFMSKIAKLALSAERFLPVEPNKEVKQDETLPQEAINTQKTFMQEISQNRDKEKCLVKFSGLSGLGDLRMELSNYEGINSRIEKPVGNEGGVKLNPMTTSDTQLNICVINPEPFYCYFNKQANCPQQLYNKIDTIAITKDSIIINGNSYALGQGFLFKPDKNNLCFIPVHSYTGDIWYKVVWQVFTKWGCDASKNTIDDDCLAIIQKNIPLCG